MPSPGDSNSTSIPPSLHEIGGVVWNTYASVTLDTGTGQFLAVVSIHALGLSTLNRCGG